MSKKAACGNCKFWKLRSDPAKNFGGGYCQRFPPIFKEANALNDGWPFTHQQEWCGEHRRRPSDKPKGNVDERL